MNMAGNQFPPKR